MSSGVGPSARYTSRLKDACEDCRQCERKRKVGIRLPVSLSTYQAKTHPVNRLNERKCLPMRFSELVESVLGETKSHWCSLQCVIYWKIALCSSWLVNATQKMDE